MRGFSKIPTVRTVSVPSGLPWISQVAGSFITMSGGGGGGGGAIHKTTIHQPEPTVEGNVQAQTAEEQRRHLAGMLLTRASIGHATNLAVRSVLEDDIAASALRQAARYHPSSTYLREQAKRSFVPSVINRLSEEWAITLHTKRFWNGHHGLLSLAEIMRITYPIPDGTISIITPNMVGNGPHNRAQAIIRFDHGRMLDRLVALDIHGWSGLDRAIDDHCMIPTDVALGLDEPHASIYTVTGMIVLTGQPSLDRVSVHKKVGVMEGDNVSGIGRLRALYTSRTKRKFELSSWYVARSKHMSPPVTGFSMNSMQEALEKCENRIALAVANAL